jgi:hypothetical protein
MDEREFWPIRSQSANFSQVFPQKASGQRKLAGNVDRARSPISKELVFL